MSDTEIKLKIWRGDQIGAERLSSTILHLDGFSAVDPQCPLGGPDGLKDVLCEKNGWKYVAAAYFPTSDKQFKEVQNKFIHDLDGVAKNGADGIVFITNQALTPGERKTLSDIAAQKDHKSLLYHLERIRSLLDSPTGYGARLEFLDIDMSREEQLSFFSQWNRSFSDQLQAHGLMIIREISKKIDILSGATEKFSNRFEELGELVSQTQSLLNSSAPPSDKRNISISIGDFSTANLSLNDLCMLHRALLFDAPPGVKVGTLRQEKIWIGAAGSNPSTASFVPPDPDQVPKLLEEFLEKWHAEYDRISESPDEQKIAAIARFHHEFLHIHPFTDGNGRIARFLLTQHAHELLNQSHRIIIEDRRPYVDALSLADNGDYSALEAVVTQAIFGVEFIAGSPCQMSGQKCPGCKEGVMDIDSSGKGVECGACGLFIPA